MGTSAVQDDPMLRLQYYRETGQSDEAKNYEAYLRETGQLRDSSRSAASERIRRDFQIGNLQRRIARENQNDAEMADAETPSYAEQSLGGIAALARNIPGAEILQAGGRSLLRGQSYSEALDDIRGAEESTNKWVRRYNRFAGALPAVAAIPGSAVLQGARYGISSGLLQADPANVEERLHDAAKEGAVGAAAGKVGEWLSTGLRAAASATLGKNALNRQAAMRASDDVLYGKAAQEGGAAVQAGNVPQVVRDALDAPDIKPFVDLVRKQKRFADADPATLLRETYKLMSKQEGGLLKKLGQEYDAAADMSAKGIAEAKESLLAAADAIMPSFRGAVAGHASAAKVRDAFRLGADAAGRVLRNTQVAGKRLETQSPEAVMEAIGKMSQEEAKAALQGMLGRARDNIGLNVNPLKGFGAPDALSKMNRLAPFLEALEKQAGQLPPVSRAAPTAATGLLFQ